MTKNFYLILIPCGLVALYGYYSNDEETLSVISKLKEDKQHLQASLDRQALTIEQLRREIKSLKKAHIQTIENSNQQSETINMKSWKSAANPVSGSIAESSSPHLESQIEQLSNSIEKKSQILKALSKIGPFSKVDIAESRLDSYFDRISEVGRENYFDKHYLVNPDNYGSLNFDGSEVIPSEKNEAFSDESQRLYAHFNIDEAYAYDSVLVKWYQQGSDNPLAFEYYPINRYSSENFIWIEPRDNWESGQYNVEIFSASETVELLSAGSYRVH